MAGKGDVFILGHAHEAAHVPVRRPVKEQVVDVLQLHTVIRGLVLVDCGGQGDDGADRIVVVKSDRAVFRVAVVAIEKVGCSHHLPAPAVAGNGDVPAVQPPIEGVPFILGVPQQQADVLQQQHSPAVVLPNEHIAGVLVHRYHHIAVGGQVFPQVA